MFTGIVQGKGSVRRLVDTDGLRRLWIALPSVEGLTEGASVAIDGVCLTAVDWEGDVVHFDVIQESLDKTTLGQLQEGSRVNVERSATFGTEIGGHVMSGHISGTADVVGREDPANNCVFTFRVPLPLLDCILPKGFVGVAGCSLTVGDVDREAQTFQVHLIPETLAITNLGELQVGDAVNIELDAMTQAVVATVERVLRERG